jgi:uncharacterized protein with FMN-binding domain
MKRGIFIASAAVVGGIGAFVFPAGAYMPEALVGQAPASLVNPTGSPAPSSSATNPQSRTLVGDTINTRYGDVQIQLKVTGTTIDAVEILQAPLGSNARFTNYAIPILIRETLKAQSANVNSVSGASYTSQGYIQSLQSAFSQL